jgi:YHS domain-containing protein
MMTERPSHLIDPVCGMTVEVNRAEAAGLLLDLDGRTFAFCGPGCRRAFVDGPAEFLHEDEHAAVAAAHGADVTAHGHAELPVIDEGMRRWYESCSCCLSEAFPEIKAQLDAERAAAALAPVEAGICEVAEAAPGS